MAEPIKSIKFSDPPSQAEVQEADIEEIAEKVSDNKEAVIEGIELLGALHESGALEILTAFIKQREAVMENVIEEINKEQYSGLLENMGQMAFLVGDLNTDEMREMLSRINSGMTEALSDEDATDEQQTTTYTKMIKSLKDPEINRSITMLLNFLKGMGRT